MFFLKILVGFFVVLAGLGTLYFSPYLFNKTILSFLELQINLENIHGVLFIVIGAGEIIVFVLFLAILADIGNYVCKFFEKKNAIVI